MTTITGNGRQRRRDTPAPAAYVPPPPPTLAVRLQNWLVRNPELALGIAFVVGVTIGCKLKRKS